MNVHFIIHEEFEGPGAFSTWIKERGYIASSTKVYLGESLPHHISLIDILIVLGGPQCPETTQEECSYFNLLEEVNFIRLCIDEGKCVIGVCLGAQLIGEALGAKFEQSPNKEIGYLPIELSTLGINSSKLIDFKNVEVVGHWHNDMPGLTATSKVLAKSEGCPRQIVEYSDRVYGFQCHLEFTAESVSGLIQHAQSDFINSRDNSYVQAPEYIAEYKSDHMNSLLFSFMDKLVIEYS